MLFFGSTISRQIKDTVSWLISDNMIIMYIRTLNDSLWQPPLASNEVNEGPEDVRCKARESLMNNIPDWLCQLVGQQSSKTGISKVFEALQEKTLNKLLLYDLVEILMYNLFPELVRSYAFQQFRTIPM